MKRILAVVLTCLLMTAPALAEQAEDAYYEGPVLAFNAPRDAGLILNDMTADSYVQALSSEGSGEIFVSAAFPSADARDALALELLDAADEAVPVPEFDAVQGHGALRWVMTGDFETSLLAPLAPEGVRLVVHLVTVDATRAYLFAAALPEEAYHTDEELAALVEWQIESLEIFDPDAKIMLEPETGLNAEAYQLAGEIVQDEEADAFLVYALGTIRDVRLSTVTLDEGGNIRPDAELGAWSELGFGEAIRLQAYLPDVLPGFAVSFTDETGLARTLYITMSGLDGTLLLIEG